MQRVRSRGGEQPLPFPLAHELRRSRCAPAPRAPRESRAASSAPRVFRTPESPRQDSARAAFPPRRSGTSPGASRITRRASARAATRAPVPASALRIDPAQPVHRRDARDRQHVRRRAHVHLVALRELEHRLEAALHDLAESLIHDLLGPEVAAAVLHPLEVRDRDAARVGENVGDDEDPLLLENRIGGRRGRTVRALADDARANVRRRSCA